MDRFRDIQPDRANPGVIAQPQPRPGVPVGLAAKAASVLIQPASAKATAPMLSVTLTRVSVEAAAKLSPPKRTGVALRSTRKASD